jgi:hypothetical protein
VVVVVAAVVVVVEVGLDDSKQELEAGGAQGEAEVEGEAPLVAAPLWALMGAGTPTGPGPVCPL